MAERSSDRHKGQRIYESGADERKRAKQQKDKDALWLAKTRRMTDFISVSEASQVLPAVSVPNEPVIDDEFDCAFDNSQSELSQLQSEPVHSEGEDSVQNQNNFQHLHIENSPTHDQSYSRTAVTGDHVNDIGMMPPLVDKEITEYWIRNGIEQLQNCDEVLFEQCSAVQTETTGEKKSYRKCSLNMFERRNRNGEIVKRSWLCFSPAHGKLYCLPCRLMSSFPNQLTRDGYCDWRHASTRLAEHERSKDHIEAVIGLARRAKEVGVIDCNLTRQLVEVENYWKDVLQRVITVITFVCERGLALRGENETIGSPIRNCNYLGILELIAEYDDFLKQHIQKHANRGSGHANYLSSTICEEFVELMGRRVLLEITSRIKKSRYYSISLDSTPDEGHIDQLTLVFRYMEKTNPVERFVKFMPNQGHKAQKMFDGLVKFLNEHAIDMSLCRGQSFDNASAMSGRYNGFQAKVTSQNSLDAWITCAGHSLNLVARAAAECSSAAVEYFNVLEDIYVFFTASTHRYMKF